MASYTNSLAPSLGNTMGPLICMKVRHVEICIAQIYGYKPQIGMDSIWNGFCFKNTFRSLQNGADSASFLEVENILQYPMNSVLSSH